MINAGPISSAPSTTPTPSVTPVAAQTTASASATGGAPKKKGLNFKNWKVLAGAAALFVAVVGSAVAIYLTQFTSLDIRQRAGYENPDTPGVCGSMCAGQRCASYQTCSINSQGQSVGCVRDSRCLVPQSGPCTSDYQCAGFDGNPSNENQIKCRNNHCEPPSSNTGTCPSGYSTTAPICDSSHLLETINNNGTFCHRCIDKPRVVIESGARCTVAQGCTCQLTRTNGTTGTYNVENGQVCTAKTCYYIQNNACQKEDNFIPSITCSENITSHQGQLYPTLTRCQEALAVLQKGDAGDACSATKPCKVGLYCGDGICRNQRTTGQNCASNEQCTTNYCRPLDGDDQCAVPAVVQNGAKCWADRDCASGLCMYSAAATSKVCKASGTVANGEACADNRECRSNYCDQSRPSSSVCRANPTTEGGTRTLICYDVTNFCAGVQKNTSNLTANCETLPNTASSNYPEGFRYYSSAANCRSHLTTPVTCADYNRINDESPYPIRSRSCSTNPNCKWVDNRCITNTGTGGGTGGGTTPTGDMCPNPPHEPVAEYIKFTCPEGCSLTNENGVQAWRCYERGVRSTTKPTLDGACGQVDALTEAGNDQSYCGYTEYTCDQARCQKQPSPSPTSTPTTPPVGPQCLNITMKVVGKPDGTTPTVGDKVTFLCGAVQGATEYQIRLFTPSGGHQRLELREPENGVARASKPFTIQQSGEYLAQCRICVSGNCQDWEEVPPRFKQPQDGQAVYQATTSLEGDTGPTVPSSEESETKTLPTEPEPTGIMKPIPTPVTQEESSETSKDTLETSRLENQNPGPVAPSPTADSTEEIKQ